MSVFTAGIVWDPREPLPLELSGGWHSNNHRAWGRDMGRVHRPQVNALFALREPPADQPYSWRGPGPDANPSPVAVAPARTKAKLIPDLTVEEPDRNVLPPLSITVEARVVQDTASITVTQLFWNNADSVIKNGAFTFPLPNGCTVTGFTCRIGKNRILRSKAQPKRQARKAFDEAVRRNRTAALLEQDTPEIFTSSLGNIPAQTRLKTEITFITMLKHRFADQRDMTTLTIPTYIANRYGSPPDEFQGMTSRDVPRGLTLQAHVTSGTVPVITSKTHKILVEHGPGKAIAENIADLVRDGPDQNIQTALVTLEGGSAFLGEDFVLDIETEPVDGAEAPQAWLETHPSMENQKALMITVPPPLLLASDEKSSGGEILFLADRSGSMEDKMDALKSAMEFFLKGIPQGRRFNVWCFGSTYTSLWRESVDYEEDSLSAALDYVRNEFRADMGGTELLPAIEAIAEARDTSSTTDVVVLTDGEVWRLEQTLDFVQHTSAVSEGRVRFFALGVGAAVSHALVEGIAEHGGGYSEVVPAASESGWEDRLVAMLRSALTEHLGPLQLTFDGVSYTRDSGGGGSGGTGALQSPADTSNLNVFQGGRVFMLLDPTAPDVKVDKVTIHYMTPNKTPVTTKIKVNPLPHKDSAIHSLAARALLKDLERGKSHVHLNRPNLWRGSYEEHTLVRAEGERIACAWSLVSKWTSFLLEDEPYEPQEDDLFMGAAIPADAAGGLDLLRPRDLPTRLPEAAPGEGERMQLKEAPKEEELTLVGEGASAKTAEVKDPEAKDTETKHEAEPKTETRPEKQLPEPTAQTQMQATAETKAAHKHGLPTEPRTNETKSPDSQTSSTTLPPASADAAAAAGIPGDAFPGNAGLDPDMIQMKVALPNPISASQLDPMVADVYSTQAGRHVHANAKVGNIYSYSSSASFTTSLMASGTDEEEEEEEEDVGPVLAPMRASLRSKSRSVTRFARRLPSYPGPARAAFKYGGSVSNHKLALAKPMPNAGSDESDDSMEMPSPTVLLQGGQSVPPDSVFSGPVLCSDRVDIGDTQPPNSAQQGGQLGLPTSMDPKLSTIVLREEQQSRLLGRQGGRREEDQGAASETPPVPSTAATTGERPAQIAFIKTLLSLQQFDGSFKVDIAEARRLFGDAFAEIVLDLIPEERLPDTSAVGNSWLGAVAYTMAIVVLLPRDFHSCESYWTLMRMKAAEFVQQRLPDPAGLERWYDLYRTNLPPIGLQAPGDSPVAADEAPSGPQAGVDGGACGPVKRETSPSGETASTEQDAVHPESQATKPDVSSAPVVLHVAPRDG